MLNQIIDEIKRYTLIVLVAIAIGVIVGVLDALFGEVLLFAAEIHTSYPLWLLPLLPFAGLLIVFMARKFGKNVEHGMKLTFRAGQEDKGSVPNRLIPFVIVSTWITHLFGGSVGREGVAVQIGAAVSSAFSQKFPNVLKRKTLLIVGIAAGFSGLFQTPMAAIFFALEVLIAGALFYEALLPSAIAAFVASTTTHYLGLEKFTVILNDASLISFDFTTILKVVFLGIMCGVVGGAFAHFLNFFKKYLSVKLSNPYKRIFIIGSIFSIVSIVLFQGRYDGLGTNLIHSIFFGGSNYPIDWLFKSLLTILCLSAGFQGGEVTPLFAIGSSLGLLISSFLGLPPLLGAALGYIAVFGSATNTLITPIFIGLEIFGYQFLPFFFIVAVFAYVANGNKSIYSAQKILTTL